MKKYFVIILLFFPLIFSGCLRFENIEIANIKDVTYQEFKDNVLKLAITTTINNPNPFKVKIKDANMDMMFGDQVLGNVTQVEHVEFAGRTQKDYTIHIAIEMKDVMSNLAALFRILMNQSSRISLSGSIQVKSFLYSKTFHIDKLSFRESPVPITL